MTGYWISTKLDKISSKGLTRLNKFRVAMFKLRSIEKQVKVFFTTFDFKKSNQFENGNKILIT